MFIGTSYQIKTVPLLILSCFFVLSFCSQGQTTVQLAKIDDMQLEYMDIGEGEFTIVIESGVGMGVNYWQPVINKIKQLKQRVIIYSRAGNGQSSNTTDVSLTSSNKRLYRLLNKLNINNNIILVGHSYGGLHVREYAASFSQQIGGIVLLDPSHEQFNQTLRKLDKKWALNDEITLNNLMKDSAEWQVLQDIYIKKPLSDGGSISSFPTLIFTSSKQNESDWWIGHSPAGKQIWRNLHASLIESNPNAIHIVSETAGHNIPLEQPELMVSLIKQLIVLVKLVQ